MKTFWKKKLPACLLALALLAGTVPMASAASADLTYDVDEDSGVWLDADDFQEIYEDDNGGYLEYVEFTDYDDFDDYGYFTFEDFDRYGITTSTWTRCGLRPMTTSTATHWILMSGCTATKGHSMQRSALMWRVAPAPAPATWS